MLKLKILVSLGGFCEILRISHFDAIHFSSFAEFLCGISGVGYKQPHFSGSDVFLLHFLGSGNISHHNDFCKIV